MRKVIPLFLFVSSLWNPKRQVSLQLRKYFLLIFLNALALIVAAQLPVDTLPHDRNAIMEEYTGLDCSYCPSGHKLTDSIIAKYPGRAFAFNIHSGSYAIPDPGDPDFRTDFGDSLAMQTALIGYPALTVNRHYFPNWSQLAGTAIMNRYVWDSAAANILTLPSILNVGLEAFVDTISRILTVDVEVYYTDSSAVQQNFLNVALVQDSVLGPQTGSMYYPDMVVGNLYQHNHILRHFLTGQWGDTIPITTQGSRFVKQYKYTVPMQLPNSVSGGAIKTDVMLSKSRVIAFVTLNKLEVITGSEMPIGITGITSFEEYGRRAAFSIFPNPLKSNYTCANFYYAPLGEERKIQIFNVTGKEVAKITIPPGSTMQQINLQQLSGGFYLAKMYNETNCAIVKFVIE